MITAHPTLKFSDFWSRRRQILRSHFAPADLRLTYNARGAFYQMLQCVSTGCRKTILLPAFHCTALVEPVMRAGYEPVFYRLRQDFSIDLDDLRSKMSASAGFVVIVHFFGFPASEMESVLALAHANGSLVVEDCAHSFLSHTGSHYVGHRGDFALFSYYKFAPSLAGGALGINLPELALPNSSMRAPLGERLVITKRLVEQMAANAPQNAFSRMLLWLEKKRIDSKKSLGENSANTFPAPSSFIDDPYLFREDLARAAMPGVCRRILESADWAAIADARQKNYRLWSALLERTSAVRRLWPGLSPSVVPWAFPVFLDDRLRHEQNLRGLGVPFFTFGEALHPALQKQADAARDDAHAISRRLMMLPVHANLTDDMIAAFADIISRYFSKELPNHDHDSPDQRQETVNIVRQAGGRVA